MVRLPESCPPPEIETMTRPEGNATVLVPYRYTQYIIVHTNILRNLGSLERLAVTTFSLITLTVARVTDEGFRLSLIDDRRYQPSSADRVSAYHEIADIFSCGKIHEDTPPFSFKARPLFSFETTTQSAVEVTRCLVIRNEIRHSVLNIQCRHGCPCARCILCAPRLTMLSFRPHYTVNRLPEPIR